MLAGQLALLFPVVYMAVNLFQGNTDFAFAFVLFLFTFIFSLGFVGKEIQKIHNDKAAGIQSDIFIFCDYKLLYKSHRHEVIPMPPIQLATFQYRDRAECISLSGDYSDIRLIKGKQYKVKYYKNSGILTEITNYRGRKNKVTKAVSRLTFGEKNRQHKTIWHEVLIILIIYALPISAICFGGFKLFAFIQKTLLMDDSDILLIQPGFVKLIFILFGSLTFILFIHEKKEPVYIISAINNIYKRIGFKRSLSLMIILFLIVLSLLFNTYTKISDTQIEIHSFDTVKIYSYNNIEHIKIFPYSTPYKRQIKLKLGYNVFLVDGRSIELTRATMFWDKVLQLNDIFTAKGVIMEKSYLTYPDSIDLLINEHVDIDRGMDILNKILIVEEPPVN